MHSADETTYYIVIYIVLCIIFFQEICFMKGKAWLLVTTNHLHRWSRTIVYCSETQYLSFQSFFFQQLSIYIDGIELGQKVHANFFFPFA